MTQEKETPKLITLPEPDEQMKGWGPLLISGPEKVLLLPDIHLPYYHRESLEIAVRYGKSNDASVILLNGDLADYYQISKFNHDPRARNWVSEISDYQRPFFAWIRQEFPKARIIHKLGNHDERYEAFLMQNCQELIGLDTFEIGNVLELAKHGVELVREKRPIRLGELNAIHGHEYRFAISNPVNPARGLFLRAKAYAICSHFHQKSEHSENNIEGKAIATWSTGCLCELHPAYMPINNWANGFAFIEVFASNKFQVHNKKVSHGVMY